jgi:hypothetical protein
MSVFAGINPEGREPLHARAGTHRFAALFHCLISFGGDQRRQRTQHGDVDVLPNAGPASLMNRRKHSDDAKQSGSQISDS